jgi:predicted dinucleotide-binding enzyme
MEMKLSPGAAGEVHGGGAGCKKRPPSRLQKKAPAAHFVKAFSCVGNAFMVNPAFPGGPPTMFICGNDEGAKKQVADLCRDWGWGVIDIGGIEGSRYLEPMCMTWVLHGVLSGGWNHAFKMLHR